MKPVRLLCALLLVSALGMPWPAWSDVDPGPETDSGSWTPGLMVGMAIFGFEGEGTVLSAVGPSNGGKGYETVPVLRLGLDVESPELALPLRPRLFGFGGVQVAPKQTIKMARFPGRIDSQPEGAVSSAINLCTAGTNPPPCPPADSFANQGSQVDATYLGFGWFTGIGASFGVPGSDSRIRLRPQLGYVGEKVSAFAMLAKVRGVGPNYTVARAALEADDYFHFLGPGLAAELVLARGETTELTIFGQADFLWNVGDGSIELFSPGIAAFRYDADPLSMRGSFGLRLGWRGAFAD